MAMRPKHDESGKGDRLRPVNQKRYADNYNRIFRKEKNEITNIQKISQN